MLAELLCMTCWKQWPELAGWPGVYCDDWRLVQTFFLDPSNLKYSMEALLASVSQLVDSRQFDEVGTTLDEAELEVRLSGKAEVAITKGLLLLRQPVFNCILV